MDSLVNYIRQRLSLRKPLAHALEITAQNGGKSWQYIVIPDTFVGRTYSFDYILSNQNLRLLTRECHSRVKIDASDGLQSKDDAHNNEIFQSVSLTHGLELL